MVCCSAVSEFCVELENVSAASCGVLYSDSSIACYKTSLLSKDDLHCFAFGFIEELLFMCAWECMYIHYLCHDDPAIYSALEARTVRAN